MIGDYVLVGPRACLTGCTVGDEVFIEAGATIFSGATIGDRSEVRVNGVVHLDTILAPDTIVPIGWVAVGSPAQLFPPNADEAIQAAQAPIEFPADTFGQERPPGGTGAIRKAMMQYSQRLMRAHEQDRELHATSG
jgi:carbonic anhydrase/acetyltransferase-like protein (isoleucine patch superfamily)